MLFCVVKKTVLTPFPYLQTTHLDNLIIIFAIGYRLSCLCVQSNQVELIMAHTDKNRRNSRTSKIKKIKSLTCML
jgi:hypothetical protein